MYFRNLIVNHATLPATLNLPRKLLLSLSFLICSSQTIFAIDQAASLALLVETLRETDDPKIHETLLRGMSRGLEGQRNVAAPVGWDKLSARLSTSDNVNVRELSMQLSQIFGDISAIERALALVKNTAADSSQRRTALHGLLNQRNKRVSSHLKNLVDDSVLAIDAIRGYAIVENAQAPFVLLARFKQMTPDHRRAVIETLATRKPYAVALLEAIQRGKISRDDIPAHVARSLHQLLGDRFVKVFGDVRQVGEDREKLLLKYKKMLTSEAIAAADPRRGRAVFEKTCATCHTLYGVGGQVGPDLTGSNRANLDYILLNSVDPSFDVPDAYKTVTVVTVDGRVINGVLAEEDGARIVLKTAEQPRVVVAKADIEERRVSPKSMMPDGQLEQMKKQEMIDLIRYLRTTEQVEVLR